MNINVYTGWAIYMVMVIMYTKSLRSIFKVTFKIRFLSVHGKNEGETLKQTLALNIFTFI